MREQEKREKIFDAIKELLAEGLRINNIKVSQIADRAGIGKGSIYMYFTSKDAVISDAIEYFANNWMKAFEDFKIDKSKDFKNIFYDFMDVQKAVSQEIYYFTNPKNSVDYIDYLTGSSLPITMDIAQKTRQRYITVLSNVLNAGAEQDVLKNINAYTINVSCQSIMMMFQYIMMKDCMKYVEYDDISYDEAYDLIYDMVQKVCS